MSPKLALILTFLLKKLSFTRSIFTRMLLYKSTSERVFAGRPGQARAEGTSEAVGDRQA